MAYVYLIMCNGKPYVGVAIDPHRRLRDHRGADTYLGRSLRKHGLDSLSILAEGLEWTEALQREIEEIRNHNSRVPNGYNITAGGEGCLGLAPSAKAVELTRQRMIALNNKRTAEERSAVAKIGGEASKRVVGTPGWRESQRAGLVDHYARTTPEERRAKTAAAVEAARVWSEERRAKHKETMKIALGGGRGWSPERRAAQAERMRRQNLSRAIRLDDQVTDITQSE